MTMPGYGYYDDEDRPPGRSGYSSPFNPPQTQTTPGWTPTGTPYNLPNLFGPDPTSQPYAEQWQRTPSGLQAPGPDYGDIESLFRGIATGGGSPLLSSVIGRLANYAPRGRAGTNAFTGQYARETADYIKRQKEDPMTSADDAALRARYIGGNAFARDTARQRVLEQAAAQGHGPTDGATLAMLADVERSYGIADAQGKQALYQYVTDERQRRLREALGASNALAGHGEGQANRDTQVSLANEAARLQALVASGQMSLSEANQRLAAAQAMFQVRRTGYQDSLAQLLAALNVSQMPRNSAQQDQASLYALLNGIVPSQAGVAGQVGNVLTGQMNSDANQAEWWSNLLTQMGYMLPRMFGQNG